METMIFFDYDDDGSQWPRKEKMKILPIHIGLFVVMILLFVEWEPFFFSTFKFTFRSFFFCNFQKFFFSSSNINFNDSFNYAKYTYHHHLWSLIRFFLSFFFVRERNKKKCKWWSFVYSVFGHNVFKNTCCFFSSSQKKKKLLHCFVAVNPTTTQHYQFSRLATSYRYFHLNIKKNFNSNIKHTHTGKRIIHLIVSLKKKLFFSLL